MGNKTRSNGRSMRRIATALATVAALVMSTGLALIVVGTVPANAAAQKWFVCKYKNTPGEPEVLQSGQNPISVASSAILASLPKDEKDSAVIVPGFTFADDQGRSVVLIEDIGQDEPSVEECAAPREEVVIAVDIVPAAATCDAPTTYSVTGDTDHVGDADESFSEAGDELTVTVEANEGYMFAGGESTYSETFPYSDVLDPDSDECAEVLPPGEPEEPEEIVEPPVTPTVVNAGLLPAANNARSEQGLALLVGGMILMVLAGGLGLVRPGRASRS